VFVTFVRFVVKSLLLFGGGAALTASTQVNDSSAETSSRLTAAGENNMAIRLMVTINAAPGKGAELAQAYKGRCAEVMAEPGCEQFEVFQSVVNPDKLALLERWRDKAALETHAKVNSTRPSLRPELRAGTTEREDYEYNRTR
jgi:quinol monooxygenase YgiN